MPTQPKILIVGAGIVGAAIAWRVAQAGAAVTVLDAGEPGGIATRNSWAWINASHGNPEPYFRLRVRAMAEWRAVAGELPGLRVDWPGSLYRGLPPDTLDAFVRQHSAWGYDVRRVGRAEIARLEPHLAAPPDEAAHAPAEGVVDPLAAAEAFLAAAQRCGATVAANTAALSLRRQGAGVVGVVTDAGTIAADAVIVAAGVASAGLLATAGVVLPLLHAPGLLLRTRPQAPCLNGLLITAQMELRQTADGRLLAVGAFDDAAPGADAGAAAAGLLAAVRGLLDPALAPVAGAHVVAHRPMPRDGFPAVGRAAGVAGLYIAVTHSGVTLAPLLGRFVADEVLAGRRDPLLGPYGPARFG